jgi:hypothetical protein
MLSPLSIINLMFATKAKLIETSQEWYIPEFEFVWWDLVLVKWFIVTYQTLDNWVFYVS